MFFQLSDGVSLSLHDHICNSTSSYSFREGGQMAALTRWIKNVAAADATDSCLIN